MQSPWPGSGARKLQNYFRPLFPGHEVFVGMAKAVNTAKSALTSGVAKAGADALVIIDARIEFHHALRAFAIHHHGVPAAQVIIVPNQKAVKAAIDGLEEKDFSTGAANEDVNAATPASGPIGLGMPDEAPSDVATPPALQVASTGGSLFIGPCGSASASLIPCDLWRRRPHFTQCYKQLFLCRNCTS